MPITEAMRTHCFEGNPRELDAAQIKEQLGCLAAQMVQDGQTIGFGSGSTSEAAVRHIMQVVSQRGWHIRAIPSSEKVARIAQAAGNHIEIIPIGAGEKADWGFDGADEIEVPAQYLQAPTTDIATVSFAPNLIKGGGGAHTREKQVTQLCKQWFVLADASKLSPALGTKWAIPVEVTQQQYEQAVETMRRQFGATDITQRMKEGKPFITDNGNLIADVRVPPGSIQTTWEDQMRQIPGVVESGLFPGTYATEVWVAHPNGHLQVFQRP